MISTALYSHETVDPEDVQGRSSEGQEFLAAWIQYCCHGGLDMEARGVSAHFYVVPLFLGDRSEA